MILSSLSSFFLSERLDPKSAGTAESITVLECSLSSSCLTLIETWPRTELVCFLYSLRFGILCRCRLKRNNVAALPNTIDNRKIKMMTNTPPGSDSKCSVAVTISFVIPSGECFLVEIQPLSSNLAKVEFDQEGFWNHTSQTDSLSSWQ